MAKDRILIVDDEAALVAALTRALRDPEYAISGAGSGAAACAIVEEAPAGAFAVAIIDVHMPGMDGLELLARLKRHTPQTQVLVLTGRGTIRTAVAAMRLGANDFLEKPFDTDAFRTRVRAAVRVWRASQAPGPAGTPAGAVAGALLVGASAAMQALRQMAVRMADADATVLVEGESGTGKELFARAVHFAGRRAAEPFVVVDGAALSATVLESELFGHSKGAFTGAERERPGLLRAAAAGTVFFDEIGELAPEAQARLLRVLQEREVRPVGAEGMQPVHARFIAATNRKLAAAVADGAFREDLYHRLNVISVQMPPLRARRADIPLLIAHLLEKHRAERPVAGVDADALAALCAYDWPGNVRELENVVLRGLTLGDADTLRHGDLPLHLSHPALQAGGTSAADGQLVTCGAALRGASCGALAASEQDAICAALAQCGGNRERTAKALGIGVATLYRKLKKYNIG
jgi:DNA-binding NtrC family response regulator